MTESDVWPIWIPLMAIEDPRMKPGHLAVLCAVRTAVEPHAFDLDDTGLRCGDPGRGIAIGQDRLRQLAGLSDASSVLHYEKDLVRWGYVHKELRPGRPTLYDVFTFLDRDFDYDHAVAIPAQLAADTTLKPGHIAAYLALSFMAEHHRQNEGPRDDHGQAPDEAPKFPSGCEATNSQLRALGGFTHSTQLTKYLAGLRERRHIRIVRRGHHRTLGEYELWLSQAAQQAWDRYMEEEESRLQQQREIAELEAKIKTADEKTAAIRQENYRTP